MTMYCTISSKYIQQCDCISLLYTEYITQFDQSSNFAGAGFYEYDVLLAHLVPWCYTPTMQPVVLMSNSDDTRHFMPKENVYVATKYINLSELLHEYHGQMQKLHIAGCVI
eukprot:6206775-Pleurochrysis_carterae.AAC.2